MPNGTSVDQLYIEVNAKASKANDAIDRLCGKLDRLSTSLRKVNGAQLTGLATGVQRLGNAMNTMNQVKTADFTRLATNLTKMGNIDVAKLNSASVSISHIGKAINNIGPVSENAQKFGELARGIAQLGYKSSTKAIDNIPKLATAMRNLMTTLSTAPRVSQNVIDMTNALARLARTGSSSGKAVTSLSKSFNLFSASSKKAKISSFSLASAIGKIYASYWLLFRAFGKIKDAIDISSKLTEVQNVVDVTFGKYKSVVEDMAKTSITDFGMSELTVKEVSSRFQAIGTAMGFAQGEMAKTSVELTKLAADMASFYNVEQKDVAKDLEAIFTGQTRPLRTYGIDLTQATLQEWALKNGIDANVKSMSQAEKTMLRYQYVMANTGAAQGDFARTAGTWANQVRILKQNFEQLGSIFGGVLINAFKPVVTALNVVIGKFIQFAKVISDSLGKIFGWTYKSSEGGGLTNDLETGADSAGDIADGVGDAADNAKKLKQQLQKWDELNNISLGDSSSGSSSGSSGTGGAGSASGADSSLGEWVKEESALFESELDTLYKLGEHISETLTESLNNIDWNSIYEGARGFGSGLASFLNGLISPDLFGALGKTIANSLNTALHSLDSFGKTFKWDKFGTSIAESINGFFLNFDFSLLVETINTWSHGLLTTIKNIIKDIKWYEIGEKIGESIDDIDWLQVIEDAIEISMGAITALTDFFQGYFDGIEWEKIKEDMKMSVKDIKWSEVLTTIVDGMLDIKGLGDVLNFETLFPWWNETNLAFKLLEAIREIDWEEIKSKISEKIESFKFTISIIVENIVEKIKEKWKKAREWWNDKKEKLSNVGVVISGIKEKLQEKWKKAREYWKNKTGLGSISVAVGNIKDKIQTAWKKARDWWKNNKPSLSEIIAKIKLPHLVVTWDTSGFAAKALQKLGLKGFPNFSVRYYAMGGFPEDGWFRANHGELMGKFDNGRTVVANNKQITQGIADAVYQGNRENNALMRQELELMRRQNELLADILEKETGISAGELFSSVRQSASDYKRRTGRLAFS